MEVTKEEVIAVFEGLGYSSAPKWDDSKIARKLKGLRNFVEEGTEFEDKHLNKILQHIIKDPKSIVVVEEKTEIKAPPVKEKKKKEDEVEKVEKKAPPTTHPMRPGVIKTIISLLQEEPINRDNISKKLAKKFPERDAEAMKRTVFSVVPSDIKRIYKQNVVKDKEGNFFIKKGK